MAGGGVARRLSIAPARVLPRANRLAFALEGGGGKTNGAILEMIDEEVRGVEGSSGALGAVNVASASATRCRGMWKEERKRGR